MFYGATQPRAYASTRTAQPPRRVREGMLHAGSIRVPGEARGMPSQLCAPVPQTAGARVNAVEFPDGCSDGLGERVCACGYIESAVGEVGSMPWQVMEPPGPYGPHRSSESNPPRLRSLPPAAVSRFNAGMPARCPRVAEPLLENVVRQERKQEAARSCRAHMLHSASSVRGSVRMRGSVASIVIGWWRVPQTGVQRVNAQSSLCNRSKQRSALCQSPKRRRIQGVVCR